MRDSKPWPPIAAALPDVETDRLSLRRFLASDVDGLAPVFAKPEVWRFPYGRGFTRDETADFVAAESRRVAALRLRMLAGQRAVEPTRGRLRRLSVPQFLPGIQPAVEVG